RRRTVRPGRPAGPPGNPAPVTLPASGPGSPASIAAIVAALLARHSLARIYTAACSIIAVISVSYGLTAWTNGRILWVTHAGQRETWPAAGTETAAARLAALARPDRFQVPVAQPTPSGRLAGPGWTAPGRGAPAALPAGGCVCVPIRSPGFIPSHSRPARTVSHAILTVCLRSASGPCRAAADRAAIGPV